MWARCSLRTSSCSMIVPGANADFVDDQLARQHTELEALASFERGKRLVACRDRVGTERTRAGMGRDRAARLGQKLQKLLNRRRVGGPPRGNFDAPYGFALTASLVR